LPRTAADVSDQPQLQEESADIEKEEENDDDLDARTPEISECADDQED
jgi:hypothetical protein